MAFGVNDGARTRDNRIHSAVLYQLSYIHTKSHALRKNIELG